MNSLIEIRDLYKAYSGVPVLKGVDLKLEAGALVGLVGENGAGKSTLIKILTGLTEFDRGEILVDGVPVSSWSESDARRAGISVIHQELQLVPELSVAQNMFLGDRGRSSGARRALGMRDDRAAERRARELLSEIGVDNLDVSVPVAELSPSQAQLVLIARALRDEGRVLVLDEPTAALAEHEREELFALVRRLLDRGTAILLVTHHLHEFEDIAQRVTVLRNGIVAAELTGLEITVSAMIHAMLDRELGEQFPEVGHRPYKERTFSASISHPKLAETVSLDLRPGEILGIAGLLGAGKTELARSLLGLDGAMATVTIEGGCARRIRGPRDAMAAGILLVPEERKEQAIVGDLPVYDNGVLSYVSGPRRARNRTFLYRLRPIQNLFSRMVTDIGVKFSHVSQRAVGLSGGNQQKLVISRALACSPQVLVLDEPTRGVDVGSRRDIYEIVLAAAEQGLSVILTSSDTREVYSLAHRVLVLHAGRVGADISNPREMPHEEFAAVLSPITHAPTAVGAETT